MNKELNKERIIKKKKPQKKLIISEEEYENKFDNEPISETKTNKKILNTKNKSKSELNDFDKKKAIKIKKHVKKKYIANDNISEEVEKKHKQNKKETDTENKKKKEIVYEKIKEIEKEIKKNSGLRDLEKIKEDPEAYARKIDIKRLVTILQKMSDEYYAGNELLVDDDTFDIMVDVLKERNPQNAFLFQTGVSVISKEDVQLPFTMPSLDKIKPSEKALQRWFKNYKGPYILMDKLDGYSMQLYKNENGEVDLFTKKEVNMGTSKKYLLKHLISQKVLDQIPNNTSIRGEMVISKKDFEQVTALNPKYKNERSIMSSLIGSEKLDSRIVSKVQFITYNILSPRYTLSEQLEKLKKWGFKIVWNENLDFNQIVENEEEDEDEEEEDAIKDEEDEDTNEDEDEDEAEEKDKNKNKKYKNKDKEEDEKDDDSQDDKADDIKNNIIRIESKLIKILKERINDSPFLVDGIVIGDDSKTYLHTESNPKHAMAFKMNISTNMKEVRVEEVIWDPSMYGHLQPVIRIKPTLFPGNVTITYITAHNAKNIIKKKIGVGSIIKIVRSGDVIPYIVDVIKEADEPALPKDIKYMWDENRVHFIVVDPTDEILSIIKMKQNKYFFRKLHVKYLSDSTIEKLYNEGYDTVISIAAAASNKDTKPYTINGLGKKMINKIYDQIDKGFKNVKLQQLMAGSLKFGTGLGEKKIRMILKKYPDIMNHKQDKISEIKEMILNIHGFSEILANKFAVNLASFCEFFEELWANTDYDLSKFINNGINNENDAKIKGDAMINQKVVMTGFRSESITNFIENNGGTVSENVNKKTTLIIYLETDKLSSKLKKGKELKIPMMTRKDFEIKYNIN